MTTPLTIRTTPNAPTSFLRRFAGAVADAYAAIDRVRRYRRTVDQLHRLNDRTLRDIGLSRDDIEHVIREQSRHW